MPGEVFGCQRRNFNPAWSSGCSSSVPAASPGCTDWMFWRFTTFPAPRGLQTFALYLCSFYFFILYLLIYLFSSQLFSVSKAGCDSAQYLGVIPIPACCCSNQLLLQRCRSIWRDTGTRQVCGCHGNSLELAIN